MLRLACCLLMASLAQAATPVIQSTFDTPGQNWAAVCGSAKTDATVLHDGHRSIRVERDTSSQDACVRLAPVALTMGKRYELSGWVRTADAARMVLIMAGNDAPSTVKAQASELPPDEYAVFRIGGDSTKGFIVSSPVAKE